MLLAPKLSKSTLNGQLLMYLAKCQLDEKPEIRVHTNVCLGKIAGYLSPAVSYIDMRVCWVKVWPGRIR